MSNKISDELEYVIGDSGPSGGIIFQDKGYYSYGNDEYLHQYFYHGLQSRKWKINSSYVRAVREFQQFVSNK